MTHQPIRPSEPGATEARADFRAMFARRVAIGAILTLLVILLGGMAYTVLLIRASQVDRGQQLDNTARAAAAARHGTHLIRSCVTPGEACYQDAQRRTGRAIGSINQVAILAAACSVGLPDGLTVEQRTDRVKACVLHGLAVSQHR